MCAEPEQLEKEGVSIALPPAIEGPDGATNEAVQS
jgi:hypothetical protein